LCGESLGKVLRSDVPKTDQNVAEPFAAGPGLLALQGVLQLLLIDRPLSQEYLAQRLAAFNDSHRRFPLS